GKDAGAAGRALGIVSVAGFAAGAVASAFGAYFILSSSSDHETAVSGSFAPETAFFSLRRSF
ncbi:MAG TPA: hypothetical protein VGM44_03980, partial [Polyangiaceae bacterium]